MKGYMFSVMKASSSQSWEIPAPEPPIGLGEFCGTVRRDSVLDCGTPCAAFGPPATITRFVQTRSLARKSGSGTTAVQDLADCSGANPTDTRPGSGAQSANFLGEVSPRPFAKRDREMTFGAKFAFCRERMPLNIATLAL